jgi:hypothetical protein
MRNEGREAQLSQVCPPPLNQPMGTKDRRHNVILEAAAGSYRSWSIRIVQFPFESFQATWPCACPNHRTEGPLEGRPAGHGSAQNERRRDDMFF